MKIKMLADCEFQDQGFPGGLRRLSAGATPDLPDAQARGLVNAGLAVEGDTESREHDADGDTPPPAASQHEANQESGKPVDAAEAKAAAKAAEKKAKAEAKAAARAK